MVTISGFIIDPRSLRELSRRLRRIQIALIELLVETYLNTLPADDRGHAKQELTRFIDWLKAVDDGNG